MVFVLVLSLLLVNLISSVYTQNAYAHTVEEILQKIQTFYNNVQTIRGEFVQETTFVTGQKETRSGRLWIKKPGLFRWEYSSPERFIIISDGRNLYVYYPDEKQAYVYPSGKALSSQLALGFMSGRGDISRDLKVESYRIIGANTWQINFLPVSQDPQIEKITIIVNQSNGEVEAITLRYAGGETVKIQLRKIEYNIELPQRLFQFTPPRNTKVN